MEKNFQSAVWPRLQQVTTYIPLVLDEYCVLYHVRAFRGAQPHADAKCARFNSHPENRPRFLLQGANTACILQYNVRFIHMSGSHPNFCGTRCKKHDASRHPLPSFPWPNCGISDLLHFVSIGTQAFSVIPRQRRMFRWYVPREISCLCRV